MSNVSRIRSVIVEREIDHSPESIWRALTEPYLIADWLLNNDFKPVLGHRFTLTPTWGVINCQIQVIEPPRILSYTWDALTLRSLVTWELSPSGARTRLCMSHSGFGPHLDQAYQGAQYAWPSFLTSLERTLDRIDESPIRATRGEQN